jgi:hypothetical protein
VVGPAERKRAVTDDARDEQEQEVETDDDPRRAVDLGDLLMPTTAARSASAREAMAGLTTCFFANATMKDAR